MLELRNISFKNGTEAQAEVQIEGINFTAEKGCVTALVGKKGCGKTTLLDILTGVMEPTEGSVIVEGIDMAETPYEAKAHIGYAPSQAPLYPDMTARSYLKFVGAAREMNQRQLVDRISKVLQAVSIDVQDSDEPIRYLSESVWRRLNLAQAMLFEPDVLIVDEGEGELDALTVCAMRKAMTDYAENHTVLLATDNLSEVLACAKNVLVMENGKIITSGAKDELAYLTKHGGKIRVLVQGSAEDCAKAIKDIDGISLAESKDTNEGAMLVIDQNGKDARAAITMALCKAGYGVLEISGCDGIEELLKKLSVDNRAMTKEA